MIWKSIELMQFSRGFLAKDPRFLPYWPGPF